MEVWKKDGQSIVGLIHMAHFVSKLSDADAEVAETQAWLDFAYRCGYIDITLYEKLWKQYAQISGGLVKMMADPERWCGPASLREFPAVYDTDWPA